METEAMLPNFMGKFDEIQTQMRRKEERKERRERKKKEKKREITS